MFSVVSQNIEIFKSIQSIKMQSKIKMLNHNSERNIEEIFIILCVFYRRHSYIQIAKPIDDARSERVRLKKNRNSNLIIELIKPYLIIDKWYGMWQTPMVMVSSFSKSYQEQKDKSTYII